MIFRRVSRTIKCGTKHRSDGKHRKIKSFSIPPKNNRCRSARLKIIVNQLGTGVSLSIPTFIWFLDRPIAGVLHLKVPPSIMFIQDVKIYFKKRGVEIIFTRKDDHVDWLVSLVLTTYHILYAIHFLLYISCVGHMFSHKAMKCTELLAAVISNPS